MTPQLIVISKHMNMNADLIINISHIWWNFDHYTTKKILKIEYYFISFMSSNADNPYKTRRIIWFATHQIQQRNIKVKIKKCQTL